MTPTLHPLGSSNADNTSETRNSGVDHDVLKASIKIDSIQITNCRTVAAGRKRPLIMSGPEVTWRNDPVADGEASYVPPHSEFFEL